MVDAKVPMKAWQPSHQAVVYQFLLLRLSSERVCRRSGGVESSVKGRVFPADCQPRSLFMERTFPASAPWLTTLSRLNRTDWTVVRRRDL